MSHQSCMPSDKPYLNSKLSARKSSKGFTLIELTVVLAIILILSVAGLVEFRSFIVSGRIDPASTELRRGMQRMSVNAEGQGATPYSAVTTAQFCNLVRNGSVISVTGTGAATACFHSLTFSGTQAVTVAPGTINAAGDSYVITLTNTSGFACPDILSVMSKASLGITVNGTTVLTPGGTFNALAATNACTFGDTNTFTFQAS